MKYQKVIAAFILILICASSLLFIITGINIPGLSMICVSIMMFLMIRNEKITENKKTKTLCLVAGILNSIGGLIDILHL